MTKSELENEIKLIDSEVEKYNNIVVNSTDQVGWLMKRRKLAVAQSQSLTRK